MKFDTILDLLMFREASEEDNYTNEPVITTGSIVWGVLLRTAIIVALAFLLADQLDLKDYWWISFFFVWLLALYPGWRQYQAFNERMENFEESTLCGSCRYFDSSSQLCTLYDEHVSQEHLPCDGDNWEPKQFDV